MIYGSAVGWVAAPSQPNEIGECWVAKKTATQPTLLTNIDGYRGVKKQNVPIQVGIPRSHATRGNESNA